MTIYHQLIYLSTKKLLIKCLTDTDSKNIIHINLKEHKDLLGKKENIKEKLNNALQEYIKKGEWESAIDCLSQLSGAEPDNPTYRLRMGDYYLKLGAKERAIEEYYLAASLFVDSGFIVKAIAIYKMVLRVNPDDEDVHKKIEALHQRTQAQVDQGAQKVETVDVVPVGEFEVEKRSPANIFPLFANMTEDEFLRVVEKMVPLQFSPSEKVIEEGKTGDSIYIISKGGVKVVSFLSGEEVELGELRPNDFFGEVSYLTGRPRTATIIATEETEVLELKGSELTELISLHDWIKERLEDYYGDRVKKTIEKIKDLKGRSNNH